MIKKIINYVSIGFVAILALSCSQTSQTLSPDEGFIDVTGGQVWYKIVGQGNQTPLLVLHGGPGVSSVYLRGLDSLSNERPIIYYDQLGCGKSNQSKDTALWTLEHYVDEISQVREALGLKEMHIYGHSWGGILAVEYALTKPSGLKSMILSGPALSIPLLQQDKQRLLSELPDSIKSVIIKHEDAGTMNSPEYHNAMGVYYVKHFACKLPWSESLLTAFAQYNRDLSGYMLGPKAFSSSGTMKDYDCTDRLNEITIPTLLTAGENEAMAESTIQYYQSLIPDSELKILENCGHLTIQDDAETDVGIIREFLGKH